MLSLSRTRHLLFLQMKTFSVKIPEGIRDGEKIRLLGQGKQGQNGGKNGDMFIKININESEKFKLKGYDIVTDLFLQDIQARKFAEILRRISVDGIAILLSVIIIILSSTITY